MATSPGAGLRAQLDALLPPGGRARQVTGWGVIAWAGIGGLILLWVVGRLLERVAGVVPYFVVAAMVVFVLNPVVRWLVGLGLPRRAAATVVFLAGNAVLPTIMSGDAEIIDTGVKSVSTS